MVWDWMSFLTIILVIFSIVMMVAGGFSAYFGNGKSKAAGAGLLVVGLVIFVAWIYLVLFSNIAPFYMGADAFWDMIYNVLISLVGVLVGALAAVGIFLVIVLKC